MRVACHYTLTARQPATHFFQVSLRISQPDPQGQRLWLPNWIVGSYMIRDFARHILSVSARTTQGLLLDVKKLAKNQWQVAAHDGEIVVAYEVYAWDLSVRGAHLDQTHAYFNGPCVFLAAEGQEAAPVQLDLQAPPGCDNWQVATTLAPVQIDARGFGVYTATDYASLLDHPVECGEFAQVTFTAEAVPHRVVITGQQRADLPRLAQDLSRICSAAIQFWGTPAPFSQYLFQVMAVGNGYGGLEHRDSTSLLCSRDDLPLPLDRQRLTEKYKAFLGLCSHEYFHAWLVKRIRPIELCPPDLQRENYTRLLWLFEGITSYYDDLLLARAGILSAQEYLDLLAQQITRHLKTPGRHYQTVTDSSLDAWSKYYKPDENTPNSVVSYYIKGSLIALCLDLHLRTLTNHRVTLDQVMRRLWREHGQPDIGVGEHTLLHLMQAESGLELQPLWQQLLYSTDELPLADLLAKHGVQLQLRAEQGTASQPVPASLGVRGQWSEGGFLLQNVWRGGAAEAAGLSAGDVLIAVEGLRVNAQLEKTIATYPVGGTLCVHAFRRDELLQFSVVLQAAQQDVCTLSVKSGAAGEPRCERWILNECN